MWSCVCRYIKKKHIVVAVLAIFSAVSIAAIKNKAILFCICTPTLENGKFPHGLLKYV